MLILGKFISIFLGLSKIFLCHKILYFSFAALTVLSPKVFSETVSLATGINTDPPFVYGDHEISSKYPGITIDILKLIEKRTDILFTIDKLPWVRVVRDVRENVLDGGFHFSFKEKRRSFVSYPILKDNATPDPIYSISDRSYVLYRRVGEAVKWDGQKVILHLNGNATLGAIRGGSIIETLKKGDHDLIEANTDDQLIKLLLFKRVDAIVGLENMLDAKIATLKADSQSKIEKTSLPVVTKPYYIAFSKDFYKTKPDLAWKVWNEIKALKESGEMNDLFKRYVGR